MRKQRKLVVPLPKAKRLQATSRGDIRESRTGGDFLFASSLSEWCASIDHPSTMSVTEAKQESALRATIKSTVSGGSYLGVRPVDLTVLTLDATLRVVGVGGMSLVLAGHPLDTLKCVL